MPSGLHKVWGVDMAKIEVKLKKNLPDSEIYEGVEYIQSTGTQYIVLENDIDYNLVNRYIKFAATSTTSDFGCLYCIGLYNDWLTNHDLLRLSQDSDDDLYLQGHLLTNNGHSSYPSGIYNFQKNLTIELEINQNAVFAQMEGDSRKRLSSNNVKPRTPNGENTQMITLFSEPLLNGQINTDMFVKASIYEIKYGINLDNPVSHLVPCVRKSDQVAGLYDIIKKIFYTNQGTGTFIVGNKTGKIYADDTYILDQFNGLKSVSSISQSTGQLGEIYYGVVPSSGSVEAVDIDGKIAELIDKGLLPNSNVEVEIYANNNLIHKHISTDSNYSIFDKKYTIQLSDILTQWNTKQYDGYAYGGVSETAYNMLTSVLQTFGYTNSEITEMLTQVASKLQAITVPIPFLEKGTYRETIDKFCQLAQMQVYEGDNGIIKFIDATPTSDLANVIPIPLSNQLGQLNTSIILKNKYDAVDIIPTQLVVENESSASVTDVSPSNKTLEDTMTVFINNPNLTMEAVTDYWEMERPQYIDWQTRLYEENSGARIEVYYSEGVILINKPSSGQYLGFDYNVEMSGKNYSRNFSWNNNWTQTTWTSSGITSDTLYNSAQVSPSPSNTWSGSKLITGEELVLNHQDYKPDGSIIGIKLQKHISNSFKVEELTNSYKVTYKIPVGYFMGRASKTRPVNTSSWEYEYSNINSVRQADNLRITIIASHLTKKDQDTIRVGNGSNIYTYGNNELLAIQPSDDITQSQYYRNAQNIIAQYYNGLAVGDIEIICSDYVSKDWDNGEVIETNDIVQIGGLNNLPTSISDTFKSVSREFTHNGVPKVRLQLQEAQLQINYYDSTVLVLQEGVKSGNAVYNVPRLPIKDTDNPNYKLVHIGWSYTENGQTTDLTFEQLKNLTITKPYNFYTKWEIRQVSPT